MVDYALANTITPFQAPNLLAMAMQGQQMAAQDQQMQTNMLAAQKFRQDLELQNALRRELGGGLDLSNPAAINRLGQLGGLDAALKIKEAQEMARLRGAQIENVQSESAFRKKQAESVDLDLVSKHGGVARDAMGRILQLSQTDPEQARVAYESLMGEIGQKAPGIARQFSSKYSPEAVRNSIFTLEQLQAAAVPQKPQLVDIGGGRKVLQDPNRPGVFYEPGVVPFSEGMPAARAAAPVSGPMGGAPLTAAPGTAASAGAFGSLAAAAPALQGTTAIPASELEARRKLAETGAKVEETRRIEEAKLGVKKQAADVETSKQLDQAIAELKAASAKGGLIERSTGSGLGSAVDKTLGYAGFSTEGAKAIAALAPIADVVLKLVPRFEGPQSNADVQSYQKASGNLADPTVPVGVRLAAARELVRLMEKRRNEFEIVGAKPTSSETKSPTRTVQRTGVYNGRRVVQYSDGTTEYAD